MGVGQELRAYCYDVVMPVATPLHSTIPEARVPAARRQAATATGHVCVHGPVMQSADEAVTIEICILVTVSAVRNRDNDCSNSDAARDNDLRLPNRNEVVMYSHHHEEQT